MSQITWWKTVNNSPLSFLIFVRGPSNPNGNSNFSRDNRWMFYVLHVAKTYNINYFLYKQLSCIQPTLSNSTKEQHTWYGKPKQLQLRHLKITWFHGLPIISFIQCMIISYQCIFRNDFPFTNPLIEKTENHMAAGGGKSHQNPTFTLPALLRLRLLFSYFSLISIPCINVQ